MKKILSIVETAYRATIEEQDDTILWLNHAMKNAGGDISILLKGNAVSYALKGQGASGLSFGGKEFYAPKLDQDLEKMVAKGIPVFLVDEDLRERGLSEAEMISGVQKVSKDSVPKMLDQYDQVWHW